MLFIDEGGPQSLYVTQTTEAGDQLGALAVAELVSMWNKSMAMKKVENIKSRPDAYNAPNLI